MEEGGFLYSSDSYADDLPYWVKGPKGPHLIIPYTLEANDMRFATAQGFNTGEQFFSYLKDSSTCSIARAARARPRCFRSACTAGWSAGRASPRRWNASSTMSSGMRGLGGAPRRYRPALARRFIRPSEGPLRGSPPGDSRHPCANQQAAADAIEPADRGGTPHEAMSAARGQRIAERIGRCEHQEGRLEHDHLARSSLLGSRNCGRKATKKVMLLGLSAVTIQAWAIILAGAAPLPTSTPWNVPPAPKSFTPSQMR